jgi:hypothetical protein
MTLTADLNTGLFSLAIIIIVTDCENLESLSLVHNKSIKSHIQPSSHSDYTLI